MTRTPSSAGVAILAYLAVAGSTMLAACYDAPDPATPINTGSAQLQISPGVTLGSINYVITGPALSLAMTGTLNLQASSTLSAIISPIPVGTGFDVAITGTASNAAVCIGHAPFSIVAGQTAAVLIHVTCKEPAVTGSVQLSGVLNVCPALASARRAVNVQPGGSIVLHAGAHDDDLGPGPLTFHWTTTTGTLSDPNAVAPTFTCASDGESAAHVTVTVSDGDPLPSCAATGTIEIACTPAAEMPEEEPPIP